MQTKQTPLKSPSLLPGKLPTQTTTWEMKKLHVPNTKQFIEPALETAFQQVI